jgi:HTH-type transcriptional regulator, sugar sensing transcriptional regulator
MDYSAFEGIGFTNIEAKVFTILLELGESKAGKIIEKSGLQSSSVYNAINSLISKGMISYIKKSEVKYYRAANPESIVDYIDMKKRDYMKIIPFLKEKQNIREEEKVEFFKSYSGIKILLSKLIKDAKKGDIYRTFSIEEPEKYETARWRVFKSLKELMREKGLNVRGIFSEDTRYKSKKTSKMQKRYLSTPLPPNTSILNDKIAIISWEDVPSGILIHSKDIAEKYIKFFEHMWDIAKK